MAAIRGDNTRMGYENSVAADTYGTALDLTSYTDARICAEINDNSSAEENESNTIGCGGASGFGTECTLGNFENRYALSHDLGYQTGFDRILAQFFGTVDSVDLAGAVVAAGTELNPGEGDYRHRFTMNPMTNQRFGTFAYEGSDTTVFELVSTYTERVQVSMESARDLVTWEADLVINDVIVDGVGLTNDNADLRGLNFVDNETVQASTEHRFLLKQILDDGTDTVALDPTTDLFCIVDLELELERDLEVLPEMCGGTGGEPIDQDRPVGTLTVSIREHEDNALAIAWRKNQKFSASWAWLGTQIGGGAFKEFSVGLPKLCLVTNPAYNITEEGRNSVTLVFKVLDSANDIPGFDSRSPEINITNRRAGAYLS